MNDKIGAIKIYKHFSIKVSSYLKKTDSTSTMKVHTWTISVLCNKKCMSFWWHPVSHYLIPTKMFNMPSFPSIPLGNYVKIEYFRMLPIPRQEKPDPSSLVISRTMTRKWQMSSKQAWLIQISSGWRWEIYLSCKQCTSLHI